MESQQSKKTINIPLFYDARKKKMGGELSISVGNNVLPSVIVKCFGVFGSHSLVLLEAAVGTVGCVDRGGVFCVRAPVFGLY